jgi:YHS domain-containing protein
MSPSDNVIDPVCGMTIIRTEAPHQREHGGSTYYLCSTECAKRFDTDGDAYATTAKLNLPGWGQTPHPEHVVKQFRRGS